MSTTPHCVDLGKQARLWLGDSGPGPQTRLFRRAFTLGAAPSRAVLSVYAESIYQLWVNGQYISRGPTFHHPTRLPFDSYDVTPMLSAGKNVIAVLVHTPGQALHNGVPSGEPGLVAELDCDMHDGQILQLAGDAAWRCTDRTGWDSSSPKRNWAIGLTESFEVAAAPANWQAVGFDDSQWPAATEHRPATSVPGAEYLAREVPPLRYSFVDAAKVMGLSAIASTPISISTPRTNLARTIMDAPWQPAGDGLTLSGSLESGTLRIAGLRPDRGAVLCLDMGRELVGQVLLECDCPTAGVIDVGWSEVAENGRPLLVRKGVSYVDQIQAAPGTVKWEPINFSGMRYLALVFRNFTGEITLKRAGVRASEPDVQWPAAFHSSDPRLDQVWEMCRKTLRVGTQEAMMDCPTREQALYVGDGHLTGRWFAQLTGDCRHWKYLVREQFRRQSPGGLIGGSVFSGTSTTLCDYTLLGVIGTRDYWQFSGDTQTARDLLEPCRRALGWFESRLDGQGLYVSNWAPTKNISHWENVYDPACPRFDGPDDLNLFIDHPGMGWHNVDEAGIDRRGANAAINALIVITRRALADLEDVFGEPARATALRAKADQLANLIAPMFFDAGRQVFIDGVLEGKQLTQVSEQTNTWMIQARCCDRATAVTILRKLLTSDDPTIARNGPYFWAYLFPLLADLGLTDLGIQCARGHWGRMLDGGADTLWETFLGDDKDTWCHPWSGAPVEFCLTGILGLPGHDCRPGSVELRPRFDLLAEASGTIVTPLGTMTIGWTKTEAQALTLSGQLPAGVEAAVISPSGATLGKVRDNWTLRVKVN